MIQIEEQIDLGTPPDVVWAVLVNPAEVVPCVPGATMGRVLDDGSFEAALTVRFGPTKVTFRGVARLDLEPAARSGTLAATGNDTLGGSRVRASVRFTVSDGPAGNGSRIGLDGAVEIAGRLAPLIEGGASVVVRRMSADFAAALGERCSREPSAAT